MNTTITQRIQESIAVKQALLEDHALLSQVAQLAEDCLNALRQGGKVIFAGNGGSFADAQHLSAEFTSRFLFDRAPLPSLALGTNNSALSAIGNDYGFEQVFARELRGIAQPNDVFIGISTSGNSPNILAAVQVAKELSLRQMAWTGQTGGKLADQCECLRVPSTETARIQECHILVG
ncbi:MAG: SIS domain-containing protein, partial [Deltaproteobacteria bacterium]